MTPDQFDLLIETLNHIALAISFALTIIAIILGVLVGALFEIAKAVWKK